MRIFGIDPGSRHTGYGVVEGPSGRLTPLAYGRISPPPKNPLADRLAYLSREIDARLERWQPDLVVLESLFHGVNTRSLIVLAQARGALLAAVAGRGLEVREHSPAEVKSAVTGSGRADKQQVARMVQMILSLPGEALAGDAADALAVAICGSQRLKMERLAEARQPPPK